MNTGQFLASLSGLSGVTAEQHLAAIRTGNIQIAYRSDVRVSTPKLRISSRILRRDTLQKNQSINISAIGKNGIQECHSVGLGSASVSTNEQSLSVLLIEPRAEVRTQAEELFITSAEEALFSGRVI